MEESNEVDTTVLPLEDGSTRNHIHQFYFVKFRPSLEELEREEANRQYHSMTIARSRITNEIENQKGNEHEINQKLMRFSLHDRYIEWKMEEINNLERYLGKIEPREKDTLTMLKPDLKRCQKRLMKKEKLDIEYLQQVQEDVLCSKKSGGMKTLGTRELNDMIDSMAQRIQHGNMNRAAEMKTFHEIRNVKETIETYAKLEPERRHYSYSRDIRSKRDTDWKRSTQHTINIRLNDIETLKKAQIGRKAETTRLKAKLEHARKSIVCLHKELEIVYSKRLEAYKRAHEFRDQNEETKSCYNDYQLLMAYAKELARKGDAKELKLLRDTQVEEFMRQWNESKAFRDDYERRKLTSKWHYNL